MVTTWVDRATAVIGFGLLIWGIAMVYVPAAFIVAGLLLLGSVLWRVKGWAA
jgi:hypothetical protein